MTFKSACLNLVLVVTAHCALLTHRELCFLHKLVQDSLLSAYLNCAGRVEKPSITAKTINAILILITQAINGVNDLLNI